MPMIHEFSCKCGKKTTRPECAIFAVLPDGSEVLLRHPCEGLQAAELLRKNPDWDRKIVTKWAFVCPSCADVAWVADESPGKTASSGTSADVDGAKAMLGEGQPTVGGKCPCGGTRVPLRAPWNELGVEVRCGCGAMARIRCIGVS